MLNKCPPTQNVQQANEIRTVTDVDALAAIFLTFAQTMRDNLTSK